jgi:sirohydrochlorin ferrochelatase
MKKALIILGHGSRSKEAVETFNMTVSAIEKKSHFDIVKGAHMELAEPSLDDTVASIVEQGILQIIIAPFFLYAGMHIKKDIPEMIAALSQTYPGIDFRFARPIGFEPVLADIILKRAEEAENS